MTLAEKWAIAISAGSLLIAVGSLVVSFIVRGDNKKIAKDNAALQGEALKLQHAAIEMQVRAQISDAQSKVATISMSNLALITKPPDKRTVHENAQFEIVANGIRHAREMVVNQYEEACTKYRDGKVDRTRFKKNYQTEIRQLVEDKDHAEFFDRLASRFGAIKAVYKEWEDKEV